VIAQTTNPAIPPADIKPPAHGDKGGAIYDTAALQKAIDACGGYRRQGAPRPWS